MNKKFIPLHRTFYLYEQIYNKVTNYQIKIMKISAYAQKNFNHRKKAFSSLVQATGLSSPTVYKIIRDDRCPKDEFVRMRIMQLTGLSYEQLFDTYSTSYVGIRQWFNSIKKPRDYCVDKMSSVLPYSRRTLLNYYYGAGSRPPLSTCKVICDCLNIPFSVIWNET